METVRFDELNLCPEILRGIKEMGFEEASPIQTQAIPVAMEGYDIIGQAQTGTGKTAAFGIPVLEKVSRNKEIKHPQALILCPTRELAVQAAEEIRKLAKYMHGIKVLPIYGGQDISKQIRALKGTQIIIGTPGRVMDHLRRKTIRCDHMNTIVLDEADEMLNMGFREDIETILSGIPEERQTVLFSATMPKPIMEIAKKFQKDAEIVKVVKKQLTVPKIEQYYLDVKRKDKIEVLTRLLDFYEPKLSLVFCNTKRMVDELAEVLKGRGYFAEGLHGDMSQAQRDRVMKSFRNGKTDILIATDVAARGIDVDDVEAVFNYDIPQDDEYYVHRIGRTGRAGRTGRSFTFVKGKEVYKLKDIMRYCKTKILAMKVPSLNDVNQVKMEKLMDKISTIIEEEDLTRMINMIEEQVNEADYTAMDIAAAFLKMYLGQNEAPEEEDTKDGGFDFDNTGAEEEGMARLFINIGKAQKVKAKDILGAIAGEANIPGKLVGAIDLYDKYTFVEVPKEHARAVMKAMKNVKIKGKAINIEPANAR